MSGYFSRIARGGGARFSGEGVRRTAAIKASTRRHLSPIDSEETLIVSPPEPVPSRGAGPGKKKSGDGVIPKQNRGERSGNRTKAVAGLREITSSSKSHANISPTPVAEETHVIEIHAEAHEPGTPSVESADRTEPVPSSSVRHRPKPITSDSNRIDAMRPEPSEKRFFESTAAIVEGQPAEPAEAQTILIREVQEWIAAGHIPSAEIAPDDTGDRAVPVRYEERQANEREPGVVRIVDRERPDVSNDGEDMKPPQHSIEEQNFELSIGSISVVVEGEDALPQPAQPVVTRSAPAKEASRSTSRLSRHYL